MKKKILLIAPLIDIPTITSNLLAYDILSYLGRDNIKDKFDVDLLWGIGANRLAFNYLAKKKHYDVVMYVGHGLKNRLQGTHLMGSIINKRNIHFLKDSIVLTMACIPKNHNIITKNGIKDISKIDINDYVLTHKGNYKKVTKLYKRKYNGEIIKIYPSYHSNLHTLSLTPEHPILIYNNGTPIWRMAKDITDEDRIGIKIPRYNEDINRIKLSDYNSREYILIDDYIFPKGENQYSKYGDNESKYRNGNSNGIPNNIDISPDFLRFLGLYIAEGDYQGGQGIRFSFHKKEKKYQIFVKEQLDKIFGLDYTIYNNPNDKSMTIKTGNVILSSVFSRWFGTKANNKRIPKWILHLPYSKIRFFIEGFSWGDGSHFFDKKGNEILTLATASEILINQLYYSLLKGNIFGIFEKKTHTSNFSGRYKEYTGIIYSIKIHGNDLYRYYNYNKRSLQNKRYKILENTYFISIKNIVKENINDYVYNFDVEDDHSYSCQHIVVHNCLSAAELGKTAIEKGVKAYIGGTDLIYAHYPEKERQFLDDWRDEYGTYFKAIIDGKNVYDAYREFQQKMTHYINIYEMEGNYRNFDWYKKSAIHNKKVTVLLGDPTASLF